MARDQGSSVIVWRDDIDLIDHDIGDICLLARSGDRIGKVPSYERSHTSTVPVRSCGRIEALQQTPRRGGRPGPAFHGRA